MRRLVFPVANCLAKGSILSGGKSSFSPQIKHVHLCHLLKTNEQAGKLTLPNPKKEQLLAIDWLAESLVPKFFKESLRPILQFCLNDIVYEDKVFKYNVTGKGNLHMHIAKVRAYYRYKSPFNKLEHKGSIIFDGDNYLTILWKITSLESSWRTYLPTFITQQKPKEIFVEGALQVFVNEEGRIFKIINRQMTATDLVEAEKLNALKKTQASAEDLEERKKIEKDIKDMYGKNVRRLQLVGKQTVLQAKCLSSMAPNLDQKPEIFQLEHVKFRLLETTPLMFRTKLDFTFYHKRVLLQDHIFQRERVGLSSVMSHLSLINVAGQYLFPHIHTEVISIIPLIEDGTVRLRWRVCYINWTSLLLNFKYFNSDYRMKNLKWYDGYSVFKVDGDGLVYHVTLQKLMPDETAKVLGSESMANLKTKIGEALGAANSVRFVKAKREKSGQNEDEYQK
uniref:Uncharacterized protein n=1 Tax=Rhabditophanes sp. KR3021 TaxID=114890 RepID=A0AC35TR62_9BILA